MTKIDLNSKIGSVYDQQAQDFIEQTGCTIDVNLADNQTCPIWGTKCENDPFVYKYFSKYYNKQVGIKLPHNHGLKYRITIKNKAGKDYTFEYWNSIENSYGRRIKALDRMELFPSKEDLTFDKVRRSAKKPSEYDVFACISSDIGYHLMTFDEFCDNLGYDNDSIKAKKIYDNTIEHSLQLSRIFTEDQINLLREIQ